MAPQRGGIDGVQSALTTNRGSARMATAEVITRSERRRRRAPVQKHEIAAESYGGELTPAEVARRHGIGSGQLYTGRREMLGLPPTAAIRAAARFAAVEGGRHTKVRRPLQAPALLGEANHDIVAATVIMDASAGTTEPVSG